MYTRYLQIKPNLTYMHTEYSCAVVKISYAFIKQIVHVHVYFNGILYVYRLVPANTLYIAFPTNVTVRVHYVP